MKENSKTKHKKDQIIQIGMQLFIERGYGNTTIQNILTKMGIAKGTFYHYFSSKEELMKNICVQIHQTGFQILKETADEFQGNALEKLKKMFNSVEKWKSGQMQMLIELWKFLQDPSNLPLIDEMRKLYLSEESVKIFSKVIHQGVKEKIFQTDFPEETAYYLLSIMDAQKMKMFQFIDYSQNCDEFISLVERELSFMNDVFQKLLSIKKGSIGLELKPIHGEALKSLYNEIRGGIE